jgi:hypothetical protein
MAYMRNTMTTYNILMGKPEGKRHFELLVIDWKVVLMRGKGNFKSVRTAYFIE